MHNRIRLRLGQNRVIINKELAQRGYDSLNDKAAIDETIKLLQTSFRKQRSLVNKLTDMMLHYLVVTWEMSDSDHRRAVGEYFLSEATKLLKKLFNKSKVKLRPEDIQKIARTMLSGVLSENAGQLLENDALMQDLIYQIEKNKAQSSLRVAQFSHSNLEQKRIISHTLKSIKLHGRALSEKAHADILDQAMLHRSELMKCHNERELVIHEGIIGKRKFLTSFLQYFEVAKKISDDETASDVARAVARSQDKFAWISLLLVVPLLLTVALISINAGIHPYGPMIGFGFFVAVFRAARITQFEMMDGFFAPVSKLNFTSNALDDRFKNLLVSKLERGVTRINEFSQATEQKQVVGKPLRKATYELSSSDALPDDGLADDFDSTSSANQKKEKEQRHSAKKEENEQKRELEKEKSEEEKKITPQADDRITWKHGAHSFTYNPRYHFLNRTPSVRERIVKLWTCNPGLSHFNDRYYLYFNYDDFEKACGSAQFYRAFFTILSIGHIVREENSAGFVHVKGDEFKAKSMSREAGAHRLFMRRIAETKGSILLGDLLLLKPH